MVEHDQTPIIVGVADVVNRSVKVEDAIEPLHLMRAAVEQALDDTTITRSELLKQIDDISIVRTWTWEYEDLPSLLSDTLGADPKHRLYSQHGGHSPGKLVDEAARRISQGSSSFAVITGGEALASLTACSKAGQIPPKGWTPPPKPAEGGVFSPTTRELPKDIGGKHGLGNPIHIYPLYENALRASRGQSIVSNHAESAELYARFAKVAADHPHSWASGKIPASADKIATLDPKKNRMISSPYPLLMNAFNTVNMSAAVVMTSVAKAKELGVPESKWIYVLGGAGTKEPDHFWERRQFDECDAVKLSLQEALRVSGLRKADLDLVDFYSCFPIVPKFAARYLGLPILPGDSSSQSTPSYKELTVLGGLTSFGGAGNNYSLHAFSEMTRRLRDGAKNGLILANGGVLSYQHVVCLSREPHSNSQPYPTENPLPEIVGAEKCPDVWDCAAEVEAEAVVETYTVEFNRSGAPERGYIIGRLKRNGARFVANHGDRKTLRQLAASDGEVIGREGWVQTVDDLPGETRNLFVFEDQPKL